MAWISDDRYLNAVQTDAALQPIEVRNMDSARSRPVSPDHEPDREDVVDPPNAVHPVLVRVPDLEPDSRAVLELRTKALLWVVVVLDAMTVVGMMAFGEWFDITSPVTAVITLGGYHLVTLGLAAAGFLLLAGLAVVTRGFTLVGRIESALLPVAAVLSVVAMAGTLLVTIVVVGGLLLLALFFGARPGSWIHVTGRGR
jgi:hypothetical protein